MAELYLVEFKGSRKEYFLNKFYHNLKETEFVVTEAERGEDIGRVLMKIDSEVEFSAGERPKAILRPAGKDDLSLQDEQSQKDIECRAEVISVIRRHGLQMKVVDVETQLDGNKMTVYFTADHRVDFRELVKELASNYKTRIELRQIGVRDEARRIGGYGVCGLKQCCNSFIKEFEPITTQHAREQDLPMNPAKISGNCGRLLCCLKYESDQYRQIKKNFPSPGTRVMTEDGEGVVERIDIFNDEALIRTAEGIVIRANAKAISKLGSSQASKHEDVSDDSEEGENSGTESQSDENGE